MSRILISGAAGNLGKACVDVFMKNNYDVIGTVSPGKPEVASKGYQSIAIDLSDEAKVNERLGNVLATSSIDAAVLTVGGFAGGKFVDTSGDSLRKMMQMNFDATFFPVRVLFQHMLSNRRGGRIVMIGSRPALVPDLGKDLAAYALSKSLVFRLAEMMNSEGRKQNFHVSVVAPGTIDTPENRKWKPEGDPSWVTPAEIAQKIFKLITDSKPGDDYIIPMYSPGA